jgi:hypothetical protein
MFKKTQETWLINANRARRYTARSTLPQVLALSRSTLGFQLIDESLGISATPSHCQRYATLIFFLVAPSQKMPAALLIRGPSRRYHHKSLSRQKNPCSLNEGNPLTQRQRPTQPPRPMPLNVQQYLAEQICLTSR